MPRIKNSDVVIGRIITERLEEMERSQAWLSKKVNRSSGSIGAIVKGRLKPSNELIESIASVLQIDSNILIEALAKSGEKL